MPLALVTPPSGEALTTSEVKSFLRVTSSADDTLIDTLIATARQHLDAKDGWLGRCILTQTWDLKLDAFSCVIYLPLAPVTSVTSITYLDTAGVSQTLAASVYRTDLVSEPARIMEDYGQVWPSTYDVVNAVTVRFVAGYATAAAVPAPIKQAMKMLIAHWYENREAVLTGTASKPIEWAVDALLFPLRVWVPES